MQFRSNPSVCENVMLPVSWQYQFQEFKRHHGQASIHPPPPHPLPILQTSAFISRSGGVKQQEPAIFVSSPECFGYGVGMPAENISLPGGDVKE